MADGIGKVRKAESEPPLNSKYKLRRQELATKYLRTNGVIHLLGGPVAG